MRQSATDPVPTTDKTLLTAVLKRKLLISLLNYKVTLWNNAGFLKLNYYFFIPITVLERHISEGRYKNQGSPGDM